jgi:hypothetical protein
MEHGTCNESHFHPCSSTTIVVYDVLARAGPGFTLAHGWAHAKRKFGDIGERWPVRVARSTAP